MKTTSIEVNKIKFKIPGRFELLPLVVSFVLLPTIHLERTLTHKKWLETRQVDCWTIYQVKGKLYPKITSWIADFCTRKQNHWHQPYEYQQIVRSRKWELQFMLPCYVTESSAVSTQSVTGPVTESLAVSTQSVAGPADDEGEDSELQLSVIEFCNFSKSNLRIFTLKLDASWGLNHRLPNCKLTSISQQNALFEIKSS